MGSCLGLAAGCVWGRLTVGEPLLAASLDPRHLLSEPVPCPANAPHLAVLGPAWKGWLQVCSVL